MSASGTGRNTNGRLIAAFAAWMVLLGVVYYAWVAGRPAIVAIIGLSSAAAIIAGVVINRPVRRAPWLMLAAAVAVNASARIAFVSIGGAGNVAPTANRPAIVYGLHLIMLILLVGAFIDFIRIHVNGREWPAIIDAAIVVLGAGLLGWIVIAQPWISFPALDTSEAITRTAFVIADVLILAALARFVTAVRWCAATGLLTAGTIGLLAYDSLFRIGLIHGEWLWGSPIEIGWMTFYAALGAAALVPSMVTISTRSATRPDENSTIALVLVGISAILPFAILFGEDFQGEVQRPIVIALASTAMVALVVTRLTMAAIRLRRSLAQADLIGDLSVDLAAATELPAIESAVTAALGRLLGPETPFSVNLSGDDEPAVGSSQSRVNVPLPIADRTSTTVSAGTLVVPATVDGLPSLHQPVQAIGSQAALALTRVRLMDEIISHRSHEYFRALVQNSTDVILIIDESTHIQYASPSAARMFNTSTLDGTRLIDLLTEADRRSAEELFNDKCQPDCSAASAMAAIRADWRLDGPGERWVEMACLDLRDNDAIHGLVVTLRDVTERRRMEDQLTEQAFHDPLTGLGNRNLFTAQVSQAIADTAGTHRFAGVLFIDLDDFKIINDRFGHVVGDAFLKDVGERIRAVVGSVGLAARIGGDEFAVLVRSILSPKMVDVLADRIVADFGRPTTMHGQHLRCGASVGVATTADARDSLDLLRHADLALYEAKGSGKQQWRRYEPAMATAIMERLELRSDLDEAVQTEALALEYQPIVARASGRTVGFEALMRWQHPSRGTLGPTEFIEIAEDSGLIPAPLASGPSTAPCVRQSGGRKQRRRIRRT